jgi:hypothetical protein
MTVRRYGSISAFDNRVTIVTWGTSADSAPALQQVQRLHQRPTQHFGNSRFSQGIDVHINGGRGREQHRFQRRNLVKGARQIQWARDEPIGAVFQLAATLRLKVMVCSSVRFNETQMNQTIEVANVSIGSHA